jgi:hypothetical protein
VEPVLQYRLHYQGKRIKIAENGSKEKLP